MSRYQRTVLVKRVYSSTSMTKETRQRMMMNIGSKDALSPEGARFVKGAIPKDDITGIEANERIINMGDAFYQKDGFLPKEEIPPMELNE